MLVPLAWSWIPDGVEPVRFLALGSLAVMLLGAAKSGFGVSLRFKGKDAYICLDQIRTVDQRRIQKRLGTIPPSAINKVKNVIREMLVD